MPERARKVRLRMLLMANFGLLWATALGLRLVDLQIMKRDFLQDKAANQQKRAVKLDAMRGFIFDRRGEVLAASMEVDSVFASPLEVKDVEATAVMLAEALGGSSARYAKSLATESAFVWIKRKISSDESERLREKLPSGIYLMPESRRLYPKGRLASHILGYAGIDGDGLAGIEQAYDRYVRGSPGLMLALRDARGSQYRRWVRRTPVHGMDITLTIDEMAQHVAEREVERCYLESRARGVVAIVLEPDTGRVLAMASAPSFDPNEYRKSGPEEWRNRAVMDTFEPGSTFKVITAASALHNGLVKPWEQVFCENGAITIGRTRIRDHDPYGMLTFREIISKSSNVGAIKVGLRIPPDIYYRDIRAFGFGVRTGIDLPGESGGLLRSPDRWSKLSQASMSMGQEVGATPLQMCLALTAIGNGGKLMRPYIVQRIASTDGRVALANAPEVVSHPLSAETAAVLAEILKGVVTDGTAKAATIEGVDVAGKTGTAQKVINGHYSHTKFMASFIGFVPAHHPKLTIGVFIDEPQGRYYGGLVAAPVFKRIAEPLLRSLGIPVGVPRQQGPDGLELARGAGGDESLARVYIPEPILKDRRAPAPALELDGGPADLAFPGVTADVLPGIVPDLTGRSMRDAFRMASLARLELRAEGSGRAVRQEPAPGTPLGEREPVTAFFEGG